MAVYTVRDTLPFASVQVSGAAAGTVFSVDGYYNSGNVFSVQVVSPSGAIVGPFALGSENWPGQVTANGTVYVFHDVYFSTMHPEVYVQIDATSPGMADGEWRLEFIPGSTQSDPAEADLWLSPTTMSTAAFVAGNQPDEEMVSEPANALSALAVGACATKGQYLACNGDVISDNRYVGAVGDLLPISNSGPSRDGRVKPDIVAPGGWIATAASQDAGPVCPPPGSPAGLLPDLWHRATAGTIMAAPHVAGVCALLMQRFGPLTASDIRGYLASLAVDDAFTGVTPNKDWGYGKLRIEASVVTAVVNEIEHSVTRVEVSPNPASDHIRISAVVGTPRPVRVRIYDARGRSVAEELRSADSGGQLSVDWDARLSNGTVAPAGVYFARIEDGARVVATRFVLVR